MVDFISEDDIEKALVARVREAGFAELDCCTERKEDLADGSGRDDKRQVVLPARLCVDELDIAFPPSMAEVAAETETA